MLKVIKGLLYICKKQQPNFCKISFEESHFLHKQATSILNYPKRRSLVILCTALQEIFLRVIFFAVMLCQEAFSTTLKDHSIFVNIVSFFGGGGGDS
jgi:hypothetical protein